MLVRFELRMVVAEVGVSIPRLPVYAPAFEARKDIVAKLCFSFIFAKNQAFSNDQPAVSWQNILLHIL